MHSIWFDFALVVVGFLAGIGFMHIMGSDIGSAAAEYFDIDDHGPPSHRDAHGVGVSS
jgi:hypothetical protein